MEDFLEYLKKYSDGYFELDSVQVYRYKANSEMTYRNRIATGYYVEHEVDYHVLDRYYGHKLGYTLKFVPNFFKAEKSYYKIMKGWKYTGYDLRNIIDKKVAYSYSKYYLFYNGTRYQKQNNKYDIDNSSYDLDDILYDLEDSSSNAADTSFSTNDSSNSNTNETPKKGGAIGTVIVLVIIVALIFKFCGG